MRPEAQTSATLVVTPSAMGLREGQISGPGQVPVLGISHDKIQHVFRRGKHDDGGVPGLGPNPDDLILGLDDAEHLPAVLSDQRQRQGK